MGSTSSDEPRTSLVTMCSMSPFFAMTWTCPARTTAARCRALNPRRSRNLSMSYRCGRAGREGVRGEGVGDGPGGDGRGDKARVGDGVWVRAGSTERGKNEAVAQSASGRRVWRPGLTSCMRHAPEKSSTASSFIKARARRHSF
eukprot:scaffold3477_cov112-Isochrysis_galbana.AAC.4